MRNTEIFLGTLCKRSHDHENTGKSLRYANNPGSCVQCKKEQRTKWVKNNPERYKEISTVWQESHKEHHRSWKRNYRKNMDPFLRTLLSIKGNSRRHKSKTNITKEYLEKLWEKQNGKCYWLDVDLKLFEERSHPEKATIDRLDTTEGYIEGNIVWACSFANLGRNKTSVNKFGDFLKLLKAIMLIPTL